MTIKDLLQLRMANQLISLSKGKTPHEVVSSLGAVQAQDYLGGLWAVAVRMMAQNTASGVGAANRSKSEIPRDEEVEKAIDDRQILRTWPMRGTLHWVAAEDAHWMLSLMAPRIISKFAGMLKKDGIDEAQLKKSKDVAVKVLEGGMSVTRDQLYMALEEAKIGTSGQRGLHIVCSLAMDKTICFGPRAGKQQTFVLLDEWVVNPRLLSKEESLAEIALRYFTSHGPATLEDFVWWSGLLVAEAKVAIEMVKDRLQQVLLDGQTYWTPAFSLENIPASKKTFLLPPYDEFLISYANRAASADKKFASEIMTKNGIFNPIIVKEGKVLGTWRRTIGNKEVTIEIIPFGPLSKAVIKEIEVLANNYCAFLGKNLKEIILNSKSVEVT